ncbi:hypothetical protein [Nocardia transvalensis]|uniref:hypothetical protein n=1 Tax=Nocardia transvalensis TaxID=37333 RepID=UPI001892F609|nr:hypothetical protein [Nocardia transvalensis]MBF6329466.1 hypothetical protein [Nocardia transvalensis]
MSTREPLPEPEHSQALDSVREWAHTIETDAGPGYRVEREPNPPFGWNLVDGEGAIVCSGSLDRLEQWVLRRTRPPEVEG